MPVVNGRVAGRTLQQLRARDAREQAKADRAAARANRRPASGSMEQFLSFIDTRNNNPDECHLWAGNTGWNHEDPSVPRYEYGRFEVAGYGTDAAHRLICCHAFGLTDINRDVDISPTCGNHLCCNTLHLVAKPHGNGKERTPVADFFRHVKEDDAMRAELEAKADRILAA